MMLPSLQARLLATVAGNSATVIAALVLCGFMAYLPLPDWLKLIFVLIPGAIVITGAIRLLRGGDQGTTDLEVTPDRILMTNIPLNSAARLLGQGLDAYQRQPLPRPSGVVQGNPADEKNLITLDSAGLTDQAEVAEQELKIPEDAVALQNTAPTESK